MHLGRTYPLVSSLMSNQFPLYSDPLLQKKKGATLVTRLSDGPALASGGLSFCFTTGLGGLCNYDGLRKAITLLYWRWRLMWAFVIAIFVLFFWQ